MVGIICVYCDFLNYLEKPHFNAVVSPGLELSEDEYIHYGTHFTNMFMRCYPERITTRSIIEENKLQILNVLKNESIHIVGEKKEASTQIAPGPKR